MRLIAEKSKDLTGYLEDLLLQEADAGKARPWRIITPRSPEKRGSQLSIQLSPGLLDAVMKGLNAAGVVVDERKPDVIRVAPAPLYNSYTEVWEFVQILETICTDLDVPAYGN